MEAGNMGINPAIADPDYIDDGLQLLSTDRNFLLGRALTSFGDTSAAAALGAGLAAPSGEIQHSRLKPFVL